MGIIYRVEAIETSRPPSWGDMDPATKVLTGSYHGKTKGARRPEESEVTEANGFKNIELLPPGVSPNDVIRQRIMARSASQEVTER